MIQNKIKISSIKNNFLLFIAFTLPLNKSLLPIIIVITMLLWIIEGNFQAKFQNLKNPYFFISIVLYLLHIVGLLYTNDLKSGTFDLEQKLSLALFPILFFSGSEIDQHHQLKILRSFIYGCALAGLICLVNAFYKYYISGEANYFFYSQFSVITHASYFAMYACFGIILILFRKEIIKHLVLKALLITFLTIIVILTSSKSGLLSLVMIILAKLIYDIVQIKKYKRSFIMILVISISSISIYLLFPKSFERISEMKESIQTSSSAVNTTTSRISIWKSSFTIISSHFIFGVGTGDVKDALKQAYALKNEKQFIEKNLNAHNQFLQTFIALGLPGILVLLSLLLSVIYTSFKAQVLDGTLLGIIIAINMLFESMLETQAGVVFIAFFLMFYLSIATKTVLHKNLNIAQ